MNVKDEAFEPEHEHLLDHEFASDDFDEEPDDEFDPFVDEDDDYDDAP